MDVTAERSKPLKPTAHKHQINTIAEEDRSEGEEGTERKGTDKKQGRAKRKTNLQMATVEDREHTFVSNPSGDEELLEEGEQQNIRVQPAEDEKSESELLNE